MPHPFASILLGLQLVFLPSGQAQTAAPITPHEPIVLFNGRDLSGFYTWLADYGYEDPDKVFTVVQQIDGAPAVRISGQHWGGLITKDSYADYRLVVEFRWGLTTWEPRLNQTRDSGILLHCDGEDGNNRSHFRSPWVRSIEYQIIEGGTGDVILIGGHDHPDSPRTWPSARVALAPGTRRWDPAGTWQEVPGSGTNVVEWRDKDPHRQDVIGYRGARDVEHPWGEWNRIEVICDDASLTYFLNGTKVNELSDSSLTSGRLLFQSEGAEIYFRRIELHPFQK